MNYIPEHVQHHEFETVVDFMNTLEPVIPRVPIFTPPAVSKWIDTQSGEIIDSLPGSVYCLDVETIKNTKIVVMASAWDMINLKWFAWLSIPGNNDRLSFTGKNIIIAHRSTFELGFIVESYSLDCQIRFFCTHVQATQKWHPAQISMYRAMPYLSLFRESNDMSLAELSLKLCGRPMDKSAVDVFITAEDETWRTSKWEINKEFKSILKKNGLEGYEREWLEEHCPNGVVDENCTEYFNELLTSKKRKDAKWVHRITPTLEELLHYNYNDVSCTVGVFWSQWSWYQELPFDYIAGVYERSIPLLPLASDWFSKIGDIEREYSKRVSQMVGLVEAIEQEYTDLVGEFPGDEFDWKVWGKTVKDKSKIGQPKWRGETGLSSKKLMRISRLLWKGRPMVIKAVEKRTKDGDIVTLKSGETSQFLQWYTVDTVGTWAESVRAWQGARALDNPTNTTAEPKDIVTVFSKTFLKYWKSGELTSESEYAQQVAEIYASVSFWGSFRERATQKIPIMHTTTKHGDYLAACLRPLVTGTVTNRAIDPIGLVISKAKETKVGSEIGGHFCAPDGWTFVFADFDSIQAIISALFAAIGYAKRMGLKGAIDILNNDYSKAVILGNKADKTSLAWLIAKEGGLGETQEAYEQAKNCSYAMIFGAGAAKLGIMIGNETIAKQIIAYFKGTLNKRTGLWEGGIASDYFNYCSELSKGLFKSGDRYAYLSDIHTSFLKRPLSNVLKPTNRGKDLTGTAFNAGVQAIDVDGLCFVTRRVLRQCAREGILCRHSTTVHDALYVLCQIEDAPRVAEIFQEVHLEMYQKMFLAMGLDINSAPEHLLHYDGVDVNPRWTKTTGDLGKTYSNPDGYDYSVTATTSDDEWEGSIVIEPEDFVSSATLKKLARSLLKE
jgi:hypothetical protein